MTPQPSTPIKHAGSVLEKNDWDINKDMLVATGIDWLEEGKMVWEDDCKMGIRIGKDRWEEDWRLLELEENRRWGKGGKGRRTKGIEEEYSIEYKYMYV